VSVVTELVIRELFIRIKQCRLNQECLILAQTVAVDDVTAGGVVMLLSHGFDQA